MKRFDRCGFSNNKGFLVNPPDIFLNSTQSFKFNLYKVKWRALIGFNDWHQDEFNVMKI